MYSYVRSSDVFTASCDVFTANQLAVVFVQLAVVCAAGLSVNTGLSQSTVHGLDYGLWTGCLVCKSG